MTDDNIIKALECCSKALGCGKCFFFGDETCKCALIGFALDLINRQKTEIEELQIENKSLRSAANCYKLHYNEARTEAYKEFAERLKKRQVRICDCFEGVSIIDIDKLVKEYEKGRQGNEFI